jgi:probable HAF family extracellular repeat protein
MRRHEQTGIAVITLFAALAMPVGLAAQDDAAPAKKAQHHHYKFIDLGTFGGPGSYFIFTSSTLNNEGVATGTADTSTPDPYAPFCFSPDCLVTHTFRWQGDTLSDLGALPGVNGSLPNAINANGAIAGISENGAIDPATGFAEYEGVVWQDGQIINLGTFGGNFSYAGDINDQGQVAGFALTTKPDSFFLGNLCFNNPFATQMLAFVWQGGALQNLGTLGGPDSCAYWINQRGEVAGMSFTNSTINPSTGFPTTHPFVWNGRHMLDVGSLGGTLALGAGVVPLNDRGEMVGFSNLAGDAIFHPFHWTKSKGMEDLGTLGGNNGEANSINDAGMIVGKADLPGSKTHDAFLWTRKAGMKDLGTQDGDPCSNALAINSKGQIVGGSTDCSNFLHAFLWEDGGPMIDLNSFLPPGSGATLTEATFINDRGEISVQAVFSNGDNHAALLIPCGGNDDDCQGDSIGRSNTSAHPAARGQLDEYKLPRRWIVLKNSFRKY